ncbi:MAG: Gfo/Idh/MocA family oxidoreductase [Capsulimonadales bacterium]|nr:Gfo/Idh/MocA family oxidoreductase [Capsulimonadales bacterium]
MNETSSTASTIVPEGTAVPLPSPERPAFRPLARPRIGIVGCGLVGDLHRERLEREEVEIAAVCDPDANALAEMAARIRPRPRLFRSEQDMLMAEGVDAVLLCTPHSRHAEQVRHALEAGAHVLCEKPFVTEHAVGSELVEEAQRRGLVLFVAYTRRSRGHARFLLHAAERIGPLDRVIITRAQPWWQQHRRTWRVHQEEGGGFLLDAGASMIDLLVRLVPSSVTEAEAILERPGAAQVDVRGSIHLAFSNGTRADLNLLGDATEKVERIQLFGQNGTAGWFLREDVPHDLYIRPEGGPTEEGDPARYRTILPDAGFVAALRGTERAGEGRELYDAATSLPAVALVERIFQVARWR